MRGAALQVVERDFVKAAEAVGESRPADPVRRAAAERHEPPDGRDRPAADVLDRRSWPRLSFLGFGLQPPRADWGLMINENRLAIAVQPWGVLLPVLAIALLTDRHQPDHRRHRARGDRPRQGVTHEHAARTRRPRRCTCATCASSWSARARTSSTRSSSTSRPARCSGWSVSRARARRRSGWRCSATRRPGGEVAGGEVVIEGTNLAELRDAQLRKLRGGDRLLHPAGPGDGAESRAADRHPAVGDARGPRRA